MSEQKQLSPTMRFFRLLGSAGIVLGAGGVYLNYLFWWAAVSLCLGCLVLAVDLWIEFPRKKDRLRRNVFVLFPIFLLVAFLRGIVWHPAPFTIDAFSHLGLHKDGELIYGITWDNTMSELRIEIPNPTNRDYEHIDFYVTVKDGLMFRDEKQVSNFPNVLLIPETHSYHFKDSNSERDIEHVSHDKFRVTCEKLPKKSVLRLIATVSDHAETFKEILKGPTHNGAYIFAFPPYLQPWRRERAKRIKVEGEYAVWNRPYDVLEDTDVRWD